MKEQKHSIIGRNYANEKKRVLEIVEDVMSRPRLTDVHIEIDAGVDCITTISYECKVLVTGTDNDN